MTRQTALNLSLRVLKVLVMFQRSLTALVLASVTWTQTLTISRHVPSHLPPWSGPWCPWSPGTGRQQLPLLCNTQVSTQHQPGWSVQCAMCCHDQRGTNLSKNHLYEHSATVFDCFSPLFALFGGHFRPHWHSTRGMKRWFQHFFWLQSPVPCDACGHDEGAQLSLAVTLTDMQLSAHLFLSQALHTCTH